MTSLIESARRCLAAAEAIEKVALTHQAASSFDREVWTAIENDLPAEAIFPPGRPDRLRLVPARELAHRGLGSTEGLAAFLHAIAHIEFNAINLAWDAVYRFRGMPETFYRDWVRVADDEARHFSLLSGRLAELGYAYGDFPAHNGLWEMAERTAHSCLARMALVPRVLEARGLDVTPGMIAKLRALGDTASVAILETILREEIAHVAAGSRWFAWCCRREGREPEQTFLDLLDQVAPGALRGPYNLEARRAAGFGETELARLAGMA